VYHRQKSVIEFQQNIGTDFAECVNGLPSLKMVGHMSPLKKELDSHLHPVLMKAFN